MADINQKNSSNRFVNPYNFIHLPEEKAMAYGETDRHTGVIQLYNYDKKRLCLFRIQVRRLLLRSQKIPQITNLMFFLIQNLTKKTV